MDTEYIGYEQFMKNESKRLDMVNSPPHYNQDAEIEAIDAIRAALGEEGFRAYCRGNAIKYLWRAELKHAGSPEDWQKANWYINKAISI